LRAQRLYFGCSLVQYVCNPVWAAFLYAFSCADLPADFGAFLEAIYKVVYVVCRLFVMVKVHRYAPLICNGYLAGTGLIGSDFFVSLFAAS
jgi:hypothetical protein